jgi:hypothetical protein
MWYEKVRRWIVAGSTCLMLLAAPSPSRAAFEWLCPCTWFHHQSACTTYAPPFAPAAGCSGCSSCSSCSSCSTCSSCRPVTCNYVPQTCYRTVYRLAPVTTCRPVSTCDPCTGCPVVTMRPVVTYALRPQLIPYTTYRAVLAPCAVPCGTCPAPCGSCIAPCGGCAAPCGTCPGGCGSCGGYAAGSGCSSCGAGPTAAPLPQPALGPAANEPYVPSPSAAGPLASPAAAPAASLPASAPPAGGSSGATFGEGVHWPSSTPNTPPASPVPPAKVDSPAPNSGSGSWITPPTVKPAGRTTETPFRQAGYSQPVGDPVLARPNLDVGGWVAYHD